MTCCSPAPRVSSTLWVGDSISFGPAGGFGFADSGVGVTPGSDRFVGGPGEGPTADGWAARVADDVRVHGRPPTVVVQACCNGFASSTSWASALESVVAKSGAGRVVAVTTPRPDSSRWFSYTDSTVRQANTVLRELAGRHGWVLVDLAAAWPPNTPGVHTPDGLHLTKDAASHAGRLVGDAVAGR